MGHGIALAATGQKRGVYLRYGTHVANYVHTNLQAENYERYTEYSI